MQTQQILELKEQGLGRRKIAKQLGLTERQVRNVLEQNRNTVPSVPSSPTSTPVGIATDSLYQLAIRSEGVKPSEMNGVWVSLTEAQRHAQERNKAPTEAELNDKPRCFIASPGANCYA